MKPEYKTVSDFISNYWKHYLTLEEDFLETQRYVTIAKDNYRTYSVQYNRLYQAIGSEIDVVLQFLCKELTGRKVSSIHLYESIITQCCLKIKEEEIVVKVKDNPPIIPFAGWQENHHPRWWKLYNKVKHDRLKVCAQEDSPYYQKEYYKAANLENVITSLAALYLLEFYCLVILCKKSFTKPTGNNLRSSYDNIRCLYDTKLYSLPRWQGLVLAFQGNTFMNDKKIDELFAESFLMQEDE